eukprot:1195687-Prorocentrum_minimum.AAC.1
MTTWSGCWLVSDLQTCLEEAQRCAAAEKQKAAHSAREATTHLERLSALQREVSASHVTTSLLHSANKRLVVPTQEFSKILSSPRPAANTTTPAQYRCSHAPPRPPPAFGAALLCELGVPSRPRGRAGVNSLARPANPPSKPAYSLSELGKRAFVSLATPSYIQVRTSARLERHCVDCDHTPGQCRLYLSWASVWT